MTTWGLWLRYEDVGTFVFGALGRHACASAGSFLRSTAFDNPAVRLDEAPVRSELPSVVAVDALLVLEESDVVREIPMGAGCVLVVPQDFPEEGIVGARKALGTRPAWVTLSHSAVSGEFAHKPPFDLPFVDIDSVSQFLPFAMRCRERLAEVCLCRDDAFIVPEVYWGCDDKQAITGYSLAKVLEPRSPSGWSYYGRYWRRSRPRHFLWVDGPVRPAFRALLDALPPHDSGAARHDIEVISEDDVELMDERTIWRVVKVENFWQRRAVPHTRCGATSQRPGDRV